MNLVDELHLRPALRARVVNTVPHSSTGEAATISTMMKSAEDFVLYLPTVNLRKEHNPAFALACRIANYHNVPCITLAVVLDDTSMPSTVPVGSKGADNSVSHKHEQQQVVMTSRRLAFLLEALSESCRQWADHGSGVAIRVHGPKSRIPDHLTLASRAIAVVVDEPFVNPFLSLVQRVENTCLKNSVPCYRVDGSTTVPPCSVLKKRTATRKSADDLVYYTGVPVKAWLWKKKTEPSRLEQLQAAMKGEFDAPLLKKRVDDVHFFMNKIEVQPDNAVECGISPNTFPQLWRNKSNAAPGSRPWTVIELEELFQAGKIKQWSMDWPGSDENVRPCSQTIGTHQKGMQRWNDFVSDRKGLVYYARRRTDPVKPHASSRMSCYLNFGIVSIFRIVHEVKVAQAAKVSGAEKFEEEIVKWREHSYAHAFGRGDYFDIGSAPQWAIRWIESSRSSNTQMNSSRVNDPFDLKGLENGTTGDDKWDAMQQYLVNTGELHNNCRMTWGKQIVHWGVNSHHNTSNATREIMQILGYLNDRYALDGLSPPSYGGLLWCIGWGDKPSSNGGISKKPASRYKVGAEAFQQATDILLKGLSGSGGGDRKQTSIISSLHSQKRKRNKDPEELATVTKKNAKTLDHFFQNVG
jgi:hypothetical protein